VNIFEGINIKFNWEKLPIELWNSIKNNPSAPSDVLEFDCMVNAVLNNFRVFQNQLKLTKLQKKNFHCKILKKKLIIPKVMVSRLILKSIRGKFFVYL
jgi:hypothetical protein